MREEKRHCLQTYKRKRDGKSFQFKKITSRKYIRVTDGRAYGPERLRAFYDWVPSRGRRVTKIVYVTNTNGFKVRITKLSAQGYCALIEDQGKC